jgi:hypothetical protein
VIIFIKSKSGHTDSRAQVEESTLDIALQKLRILGGFYSKYNCIPDTNGVETVFVPFEQIAWIKEITE